jgi:hypothetical protein
VAEAQRAGETQVAALCEHIIWMVSSASLSTRSSAPNAHTLLKTGLSETIVAERADRQTEIKTAVEKAQRAVEAKFETKLASLEERRKTEDYKTQHIIEAERRKPTRSSKRPRGLYLNVASRSAEESRRATKKQLASA